MRYRFLNITLEIAPFFGSGSASIAKRNTSKDEARAVCERREFLTRLSAGDDSSFLEDRKGWLCSSSRQSRQKVVFSYAS